MIYNAKVISFFEEKEFFAGMLRVILNNYADKTENGSMGVT